MAEVESKTDGGVLIEALMEFGFDERQARGIRFATRGAPSVNLQDVASKRDLSETELRLKLEIEKVRGETKAAEGRLQVAIKEAEGRLKLEIKEVEGRLQVEMREVEGRLALQIEGARRETKEAEDRLKLEIEKVRGEIKEAEGRLQAEIEKMRGEIKEAEGRLKLEIKEVEGRLQLEIEKVRGEIKGVEKSLIYWMFGLSFTGIVSLGSFIYFLHGIPRPLM